MKRGIIKAAFRNSIKMGCQEFCRTLLSQSTCFTRRVHRTDIVRPSSARQSSSTIGLTRGGLRTCCARYDSRSRLITRHRVAIRQPTGGLTHSGWRRLTAGC